MSGFAIAIEYLTGYSVATDHTDREKPEWPPHPARLFMALAAAHFETDASPEEKYAERAALEWLAGLDAPALALPPQAMPQFVARRDSLTVYVPVNDATGIDVLPTKRSRQPRMFPRVYVGTEPIRFVYSSAGECSTHLQAIELLCRKVTRVGHSSSLVWVRLERDAAAIAITHECSPDSLECRLRTTNDGAVGRLEQAFNAENIQKFRDLAGRIAVAKGNAKTSLKSEMSKCFPSGEPISQRPAFSISSGYKVVAAKTIDTPHSPFDPNLIVLKEGENNEQSFGLESTLLLMTALRGLILSRFGNRPPPDWVSGHAGPNGPKLSDGRGHMALIALPFVGREHADGHVMGLAIALPREIPARERATVLGRILFDEETNEPKPLKLMLGAAGEFEVQRETSFSPKFNLQPLTWTRAARLWQSVTPVVLDRIPKSDRTKHRQAWNEEVATIVCDSCIRQNLPTPIAVRAEKTPFFIGSLRAMPGQGGFPLLRPGTFQVHIEIDFGRPVQGPILLGAGRFRGYGLCRPAESEASR